MFSLVTTGEELPTANRLKLKMLRRFLQGTGQVLTMKDSVSERFLVLRNLVSCHCEISLLVNLENNLVSLHELNEVS